ncbi:MAG TPA: hypothetical protein PJ982_01675 [Lacipirellulaceae bacterium]|nr:hypothetical protein [Lacipirellulaceae bacterium]
MRRLLRLAIVVLAATPSTARAEPPVGKYLFPAGGQRGTTVQVHAGGLFLNKSCQFEVVGPRVRGPNVAHRALTPVFEGPLLPLPESQRQEDYPRAVAAEIQIAADAPPGIRWVRMWTSQGVTAPMPFVVGDLPEIVEHEIDGDPIPVLVKPPVVINGRIYPRENIDAWSVALRKGQAVRCVAAAASLGSPLEARLSIHDEHGRRLEESRDALRTDPAMTFVAPADGTYQVGITDARGDGDMPTPKAPQAEEILKHVERYGFGFDVDRATNQAGLRFDLTCVSAAAAAEVSGALAELLPVMKAELESRINAAGAIPPLSKTEQEYIKLWHSLVDRCTVRVASFSDGAASVQIASTADFPSSLVGMQELAERATVPENQIR